MFSWKPGGSRAGEAIHCVWRIPDNVSDRQDNKAFTLQAECLAEIAMYHSRVKNTLYLATVVRPSFIVSKAVACAMYMHLTGDHLPIDHCKGKANAILVAELALATQDFDIIQDLRILNGRPQSTNFDEFWYELKSLFEAHARVDD